MIYRINNHIIVHGTVEINKKLKIESVLRAAFYHLVANKVFYNIIKSLFVIRESPTKQKAYTTS